MGARTDQRRGGVWKDDAALLSLSSVLGLTLVDCYRHPLVRALPPPQMSCFEEAIHLAFRASGLALVCEPQGVGAVQLYAEGHAGYAGWTRRLPCGLDFEMGQEVVRDMLGPPSLSGPAQCVPGLGWKPRWDLFRAANSDLHVEYGAGPDDGLQMVTIQAAPPRLH